MSSFDNTAGDVPEELSPVRVNGGGRLSVVIPTLNEARNLPYVLSRIPRHVFEVVLVDGHSVDETVAVARRALPEIVVVHQSRAGKGNALAAGFAVCRGDYIAMIDADGSMNPAELDQFVMALDDGAHYVKGSRFLVGGGTDDITPVRRWGNRGLNLLANVLFGTRYSDLCYGYNVFRRDCLPLFGLPAPHDTTVGSRWGDGFEVETLLNTRVAVAGLEVREVPSFESRRLFGSSNLRVVRDGLRALLTILIERVRARRCGPEPLTEWPIRLVAQVEAGRDAAA